MKLNAILESSYIELVCEGINRFIELWYFVQTYNNDNNKQKKKKNKN